eukprot:6197509-Pleurochrysis_carterae.AAC.1
MSRPSVRAIIFCCHPMLRAWAHAKSRAMLNGELGVHFLCEALGWPCCMVIEDSLKIYEIAVSWTQPYDSITR